MKSSRQYILIARPNISSTQATSDASALTLLGANIFVRCCGPGLFSDGLSKEPGDGSAAQHERCSRLHRKPIYHSSRGIVRFGLVLYECEECHDFRYWRSCRFRGIPSSPGGDHNVRPDCRVRVGYGHADRYDQRPLSGPFIDHDTFFLPVLEGTFAITRPPGS